MAINLEALKQLSQHPKAFELFCKQYLDRVTFQRSRYAVDFQANNVGLYFCRYLEKNNLRYGKLDLGIEFKTQFKQSRGSGIVISEYIINHHSGALNQFEKKAIRDVVEAWRCFRTDLPKDSPHSNNVKVSIIFICD